jgi:hypothetical protein
MHVYKGLHLHELFLFNLGKMAEIKTQPLSRYLRPCLLDMISYYLPEGAV